ncbi:MAG: XisH family protein [Thermomicrobiales bacterium]
MPARDRFHSEVRRALQNDGWRITDDPLRLKWGRRDLFVDLGAEQVLAAEKGPTKIAVEVKSFLGPSVVDDLEKAVGQFLIYQDLLDNLDPERQLYLAVTEATFENVFDDPLSQLLLRNRRLQVLVFDPQTEVIRQWTPEPPTARSSSAS